MAGTGTRVPPQRRTRRRPPAPGAMPASAFAPELCGALLETVDAQVAVLDAEARILHVNDAWRRFSAWLGDSRDHVGEVYMSLCERAHEELAARIGDRLPDLLAGRAEEFEVEYPCRDERELRWFVVRGKRMNTSGHVLIVHQEVSARRVAADQAALHAALIDEVDAAIVVTDLERTVISWSKGAEELYGWPRAKALGRDLGELVVPDDDAVVEHARRAIADGDPWDGSFFFVRPDGARRAAYSRMRVVAGGDGRAGVFVVVSVDVTEREALINAELERLAWVTRIQAALAEDRFVLHAQPIIEIRTGEVVQRELLLRMRPPADWEDQSLIAPAVFLPAAEQHGLIGEIDRWVIDRAAALAAAGFSVELNVSGPSVSDLRLPERVAEALAVSGADPRMLTFEITETTLVSDEEAARAFVERMHALGCRIALDDFGTGYGTFTYLKQLPIDYLKIDIEFVRDLADEPASRNVVEAIVSLARSFGLSTVAEGVEDDATLELLRRLGVDYAQGYHIGRPMPLQRGPARSGARIRTRRRPARAS
jgi:PAS domain S-box-containing protein